jgi:hypothetical protein
VTERAKLRAYRRQSLPGTAIRAGCLACAIAAATCAETLAQAASDSATPARIHIGPLSVAPTLALTNLGRDSNVFNEARDSKSDLTATLAPSAQLWLRMGRAQLSGSTHLEAIFYDQYSRQGTVSTMNTSRLDMVFNHLRPFVSGSFLRLHDRPSAEIDARVQRVEQALKMGASLRLASRTSATVSFEQNSVSFGGREGVLGSSLRHELDRSQQLRGVGLLYELTPLTTLVVEVQEEQTRFQFAGDRNATGIRLFPGFVFKPRALVSGDVHVGFLRYSPADPRVPRFAGVIAAVNVRSIIAGANELTLAVDRDLSQSIEAQVYYVQTRASAAMTRQLNDRWNLSVGLSRLWLSYSSGAPGAVLATGAPVGSTSAADGASAFEIVATRPDTVSGVGFGVGYRLTRSARVGFSVGFAHRDAALASGRYDNLRTLTSVTYAAR